MQKKPVTNNATDTAVNGYKVFLIGMMGSGKSYWSSKIAKKLKCGSYDLDHLVENLEEKSIAEIFAEDGEEYFRKAEAKLLRWFEEKKSFVLATGGGTPCLNNNMEWMNKNGITIWIDETPETMAERLKPAKAHRPLISDLSDNELVDFLSNKLLERTAAYSQAKYRLSGEKLSEKNIIEIIKQHA